MIVTCPACGACYQLDASKLSGRGAKITCPRCRHKFVIYREADDGDDDQTLQARQPPGDSRAAADGVIPSVASASTSASTDEPEEELDVHSLDFAAVGIRSWKVKVKLGLVYDFSDFKTLSKYISEGRVTSTDMLSHNGDEWTEIGEIPDLEKHFVDTWRAARRAADAGEVEDFDDDDEEPTNILGMAGDAAPKPSAPSPIALSPDTNAMQDALSEAVADISSPGRPAPGRERKSGDKKKEPAESPRFQDPFEALKAKKKRERSAGTRGRPGSSKNTGKGSGKSGRSKAPTKAAPQAEKKSNAPALVVLVLLLLGGAGYGLTIIPDLVAKRPPEPNAQQLEQEQQRREAKAKKQARIDREKRLKELADAAKAPADDGGWVDENPEDVLTPVGPRDSKVPGATPQIRAGVPGPSTAGGGDVQVSAMTAEDHAGAGDRAAQARRWSEAAKAYGQAVQMAPRNASYQGKLGIARYHAKDLDGALGPLTAASNAGYTTAHKFLGHLNRDLGDTSGASAAYQNYLATNPPDRAAIERALGQL